MPTTLNLKTVVRFLGDLAKNNSKPWFDEHRKDYDNARAEFETLVELLINEFRESDNLHDLVPKKCVARIYRDIRFSKDKTPYKTNMAAIVAPGGWKTKTPEGYYISIGTGDHSLVAGGLYEPTADQLNRFRQAIDSDPKPFKKIIGAKAFKSAFGELEGERLKTAPKGYDRDHPDIDLLQLKRIVVFHRFTTKDLTAPDFVRQVIKLCKTMRPFLDYVNTVAGPASDR